jgi:hypothetical protein
LGQSGSASSSMKRTRFRQSVRTPLSAPVNDKWAQPDQPYVASRSFARRAVSRSSGSA